MQSKPRSARIRVAIVSPGPETQGGITEVVRQMLPALEATGQVRPVWIATHRTGSAFAKAWAMVKGLAVAMVEIPRCDVVHIHSSYWVSCLRKSLFLWLAKLWRKPVIWHLHAGSAEFSELFDRPDFLGRYARAIVRRANRIVVLTEGWQERVGRLFSGQRIEVLRNPAPTAPKGPIRQRDRRNILYLGRLFPRKGHDDLLRAFVQVAGDYPDARLVYAGSGDIEDTKALARSLGVRDKIDFLGWVSGEDKSRVLDEAMVFALPSHQEASPVSILEAIAADIPVVSTPVGGIPELLEDGVSGMLVPVGDSRALGLALCRLLRDPSLRAELAGRARKTIEGLDTAVVARHWVRIYVELMRETEIGRARDKDRDEGQEKVR